LLSNYNDDDDTSISTSITSTSDWSMFKRDSSFKIWFCDGEKICKLNGCYWNSFSFNCQVNSLITASLSFQSLNDYA
jgi:hypothetical protein